jgi:hypothetical protein
MAEMEGWQPLNRDLFSALQRTFGGVKVANQGERRIVRPAVNALGEKVNEVLQAGEQYRVCCPYCKETRYRLYICYRWNTFDSAGNVVDQHLAKCFNEECSTRRLEELLTPYISGRPTLLVPVGSKMSDAQLFSQVSLPGRCVPVNSLPATHQARKYLEEQRKFDVHALTKEWGVHVCVECPEDDRGMIAGTTIVAGMVRGRVIIPIYRLGQLVGWQARFAGEPPGKHVPKYYTMPGLRKNYLLYNGDQAKQYPFGVVVEGVTDAWRVGPRCVALLGKTMSHHQQRLVQSYWGTGGVCVLLDPDAVEEAEDMLKLLQPAAFRWGSFSMTLPDGTDPADLSHDELWRLIVAYARNRGIQLAPG